MAFDLHPILNPRQTPTSGLWYAVAPEEDEGSAPAAKVGSCANFELLGGGADFGRVLLSAGATPEGPFPDLHQLRIGKDSMKWASLPRGDFPARYEHASFLAGECGETKLFTFAGANQSGPLSDVWKFEKDHWTAVKTKGSVPSRRTYHTSSSVWSKDHSLIVFGGGDAGSSPVADRNVHVFNPASSEWSSPRTTNLPPSPRQGHISVVVGDKLFVHGGMAGQDIFNDLYTLDIETWSWSCPQVHGATPPRLAAHGCAVIGKKIYIFGGLSPTVGASDQLYTLDTETLTWENVAISGPPPPSRLDHAMCTVLLPSALGACPNEKQQTTGASHTCNGERKDVSSLQTSSPSSSKKTPNIVTLISPDSVEKEDFVLVTNSTVKTPTQADNNPTTQVRTTGEGAAKSTSVSAPVSTKDTGVCGTQTTDSVASVAMGLEKTSLTEAASLDTKDTISEDNFKAGASNCRGEDQSSDNVVPVLFIFGGMDTSGNIHGDCFMFRP